MKCWLNTLLVASNNLAEIEVHNRLTKLLVKQSTMICKILRVYDECNLFCWRLLDNARGSHMLTKQIKFYLEKEVQVFFVIG